MLTLGPAPDWLAVTKVAVALAWLALLFLGERLWPAAPRPADVGLPRLGRNGAFWVINTILSPLVVLPILGRGAPRRVAAGLVVGLVRLCPRRHRFLIYWWHQANHRIPFLWRFHEVHHLDGFLDSTSAVRFHFGEVLLSAVARAIVILLLGFPFVSVLVFEALLLCATLFHHSNVRLPPAIEGVLSVALVTPSIHWVHHHDIRADTNSNYGTLFSFWDRLFRTRSPTARTPTMPIGVEGKSERALSELLAHPFARNR